MSYSIVFADVCLYLGGPFEILISPYFLFQLLATSPILLPSFWGKSFVLSFCQWNTPISPPARWGLLDFIRAVLLLRLRILLLHLLLASSSQSRSQWALWHCRTSTASSRSQWALPDLHRELKIPVGTAGPQPRLPGCSGHCRTSTATSDPSGDCRTSTATSRSQWALPGLNRDFQIAVGTAGPQREEKMSDRMSEDMPDRMPERMSERMSEDMPDRMSEDMPERMSEDMSDRMSEDMPDRMPEKNVRRYAR